jgi:hypothetical protein
MSLIIPGSPGFTFCADTNTGSPPTSSPGVSFGSNASANLDGTPVTLLPALARDACLISVRIAGTAAAANITGTLADLLIDPAGGTSWAPLVDDLVCGGEPSVTTGVRDYSAAYTFPLWIPAGASIGIQARRRTAGISTSRAMAWVYGEPRRPELWWCGQGVESLGINAASSSGTSHTPGAVGAYSAWATIGTSTRRYGAAQFGVNVSNAVQSSASYYWQIGTGSTQLPGSPTFYVQGDTNEAVCRYGAGQPLFCDVPAGTAIQCRSQCSIVSPQAFDVAFYGCF